MIIKQLSIFIENRSGRLTEVTKTLAEGKINLSAFCVADSSEYGILRLIVSDPDKALKLLKDKGMSVNITDVVGIVVPHEPGGLYKAIKILSDEKITIEYLYAYGFNERASVILKTDNIQNTIAVLQKHKMELLKASQIYEV